MVNEVIVLSYSDDSVVKSIIVEDIVCFPIPSSITSVAEDLLSYSGIHRHCIYTMNMIFKTLSKSYTQNPQDPVVPLWGIYPKDAQSYHKNICSTMFIAALFVIARTWKQPKCPSTDKENEVHLHNGVLHLRKNDILNFSGK